MSKGTRKIETPALALRAEYIAQHGGGAGREPAGAPEAAADAGVVTSSDAVLTAFVAQYRAMVGRMLDEMAAERALRYQYDALDLGNVLQESHFTGLGFTKAQFLDAVSSMAAMQSALGAGHKTNLYRVRP